MNNMWRQFAKYFNKYPKQRSLAKTLLKYGLRVEKNKIYCGKIQLSDSKIAKAFNFDRRIISETTKTISQNKELEKVFSNLSPTCNIKDVAPKMKWGVIEIVPIDPSMPGILADVSKIVADEKISIRQAIVDDFELSEEPRLFIITEKQLPPKVIPKIRELVGVEALVIY
jgi:predicted regulator of amino acid metabolism with ACT domain